MTNEDKRARPARMESLARLPVFFALRDRDVVLVGGSAAAAWKAELIQAAGARLRVFAPHLAPEFESVMAAGIPARIVLSRRAWTPADLAGAAFAVGAFEDDAADEARAFADACRARGLPVNVVDRPALCDFAFGSIVNRSPLVIGISTDGVAPVLGQAIRARIESLLPAALDSWLDRAIRFRTRVSALGWPAARRRRFWERFAAAVFGAAGPGDEEVQWRTLIADAPDGEASAAPAIVRLDPADPDSLTVRDIRALMTADIVLVDDGLALDAVPFVRREASVRREAAAAPPADASSGRVVRVVRT